MASSSNRNSNSSASRRKLSSSRKNSSRLSQQPKRRNVTQTTLKEARRAQQSQRRSSSARRGSAGMGTLRGSGTGRPPRKPTRGFSLIAVVIIVAVVAVAAFFGIRNLPIFRIQKVSVSPTTHISADLVTNLTQVPEGSTLFNVNTKEIEARLVQNPWIESVKLERRFPSTLKVNITERQVGALVAARGGEEAWYIGADGTWIEPIPIQELPHPDEEDTQKDSDKNGDSKKSDKDKDKNSDKDKDKDKDSSKKSDKKKDKDKDKDSGDEKSKNALADVAPEDDGEGTTAEELINTSYTVAGQAKDRAAAEGLIFIYNIDPQIVPEAGTQVQDSGLSGALEYTRDFSPNLKSRIARMVAPNKSSITMMLDSGVQIALGIPASLEDIHLKESVITNLLAEHEGEVTYINVRVPTKPAWRGIEKKSDSKKSKDGSKNTTKDATKESDKNKSSSKSNSKSDSKNSSQN